MSILLPALLLIVLRTLFQALGVTLRRLHEHEHIGVSENLRYIVVAAPLATASNLTYSSPRTGSLFAML